ncbi:MAG TPA: chemotaxis protein, partial [Comamonadaceae bacterium]|nr:chemotaxis protein [Comamonadaceae bacterium]
MAIFDTLFKKKGSGAEELDASVTSEQDIARLAAQGLATRSADEDGNTDSQMATPEEVRLAQEGLVDVPLLGRRPAARHQRTLTIMLGAGLLVLGGVTLYVLSQTEKVGQQVAASGQALMQSQRLAKSVSQALVGNPSAFPEVREASTVLAGTVRALKNGSTELGVDALGVGYGPQLDALLPKIDQAERNAQAVLAQTKILTQVGDALRTINRQSSDLLEVAETVSSLKLQQNAPAAEISAAGQLVMLTQRIGKSANEFLTMEGVSPEAVFLLGKDLNTFKEVTEGLLNGSEELRLTPARDAQVRERLQALMALYEQTRTEAGAILGNLQGLVSAREAQSAIVADSEPLRLELQSLQDKLSGGSGLGGGELVALVLSALFALACGGGLAYVQLQDSRQRQRVAESQRMEAEQQQ